MSLQVREVSYTKTCAIKACPKELVANKDRTRSSFDGGSAIRTTEGRFLEGGWHTWDLSWQQHHRREQGSSKQHTGLGEGKPGVVTTEEGARNSLHLDERGIAKVRSVVSFITWRAELRLPLVEPHGGSFPMGSTVGRLHQRLAPLCYSMDMCQLWRWSISLSLHSYSGISLVYSIYNHGGQQERRHHSAD